MVLKYHSSPSPKSTKASCGAGYHGVTRQEGWWHNDQRPEHADDAECLGIFHPLLWPNSSG